MLTKEIREADIDTLRTLTDKFKEKYSSGVIVLGTVINEKPQILAVVTDDLVKTGIHAGNIVKKISPIIGGGGGGRPNMAQAGGSLPEKLDEALNAVKKVLVDQINL